MERKPVLNQREAELLAILLHGEKYGRAIRDEYQKRTGKALPLGSLYVTLDRIEEKGFVKSRLDNDRSETRSGNRKRFFRLTAMGSRSLTDFQEWCMAFHAGGTR